MKRNEMVAFMVARYEFYSNKFPEANINMIMHYILKGMEASGMQPPEIRGMRLEAVDPFKINQWEPEDETK
jgi:hypothetical protein